MPTADLILDGISYYITDYDPSNGLNKNDLMQTIRNIHQTNTQKSMASLMANTSISTDRDIYVNIDNPDPQWGGVSRVGFETTFPGNNVDTTKLSIELYSSDLTDGKIYKELGSSGQGTPIQKSLDQIVVHEFAHIYDFRVNGYDIFQTPNLTVMELHATAQENAFLRELGLKERDYYGSNPAFVTYHLTNGTPVIDPVAGTGLNFLSTSIYDSYVLNNSPLSLLNWSLDPANQFNITIPGKLDPLLLDLDGDGFHLTISSNNDIYFDMDGDSFAEATSWSVDADDGFLVRDINANGRIDGIQEMFGNASTDGFTALRAFDTNSDGVINSSDAIWSSLKVWKDADFNGQTLASELHTLSSLGITGINVGLSSINITDITGTNWRGLITDTSTATTATGTITVGNAQFSIDQRNSDYVGSYTIDPATYALPDKRGYHNLMSLRDALNVDTSDETAATSDADTLREKFEHLASQDIAAFFTNYADNADLFERAIFQWAGVVNIAANSRGSYLSDARIVEFMEEFFGNPFTANDTNSPNPGLVQAQQLEDMWLGRFQTGTSGMLQNFKAGIFAQMSAGNLFENDYYDYASDAVKVFSGTRPLLDLDVLSDLEGAASALSTNVEKQDFWLGVIDFIRSTVLYADGATGSYDNYVRLTSNDITSLDNAIKASTSNVYDLEDIKYRHQNPVGESLTGTSGNDYYASSGSPVAPTIHDDTIYGLAGFDRLSGGDGNDYIYANTSDTSVSDGVYDQLWGNNGNDVLYADAGGDMLYGGNGSDHLIGNISNDFLIDSSSGQNLLEAGAGDDYYYIGSGETYINDISGTDFIVTWPHGPDVNSSGTVTNLQFGNPAFYLTQFSFSRFGNDGLKIIGNNSSTSAVIYINNQFSDLNSMSGTGVEYLLVKDNVNGSVFLNLKSYLLNYTGSLTTNGTDFADNINGITAGSLNDIIFAKGGNDIIHGDAGNDEIYGGNDNDTLYGDAGNDKLYGEIGNDILSGGDGNDELYGNAGNDIYIYSSGDDIFSDTNGNSNADEIRLESGVNSSDLTFIRTLNDMRIDIAGGGSIKVTNQLSSAAAIETLRFADNTSIDLTTIVYSATYGTNNGETLNGLANADTIYLLDGNDTSSGNNGNDIIYGGNGNDTINGNDGNDTLYGDAGNDTLDGGAGDDIFYGGDGDDIMWSGSGNDTYIYSSGNDTIREVNSTVDQLNMADDILASQVNMYRLNNDLVINVDGHGSVTIINHFAGNRAVETIDYHNDPSVSLWGMNYITKGTVGVDYISGIGLVGSNIDEIYGYDGNDNIQSEAGNDLVYGGNGNDTINGGNDNDILYGDDGDDNINGGAGNDILYGGAGNDNLTGYTGSDIFVFNSLSLGSIDTITDFNIGQGDKLDISGILFGYDPLTSLIDDFISFTGTSNSNVWVDRDGAGSTYSSQQIATLSGVTGLDADTMLTNGNLIA